MKSVVIGMALIAAAPVYAQSSLGITGADLSFGIEQDEDGAAQKRADARVDVAITGAHGLQGDLGFADTANGTIGRLTAHLYLRPNDRRKYGLFASLSDVDGRSMLWGSLGAEGIFAIGEATSLEARTGLGASDVDGLDFIFAGLSVAHDLSPDWQIEATLDAADFDETAFRATAYNVNLTARYSRDGEPWGAYASVDYSDLTGRDGTSGEVRLGLGVTVAFGATGGAAPATRPFTMHDPVAPLVRRGLW